jgi:hypothetical protein
VRALARDIVRCAELESVLDGRASPCREVARWQGMDRSARWYVPEPWAGRLGTARILFASSNPSAGEREEPYDPRRHMSRRDSDEDLIDAADGAFTDRRFPGIARGCHSRARDGRVTERPVMFWQWALRTAKELLGRDPVPGDDYALTEVVHCGSRGEEGVRAALGTCSARYLHRVMTASPARVVIVVGARARGAFEGQLRRHLNGQALPLGSRGWAWHGDLLGRTRYVLTLPHPNARAPSHGLAATLGPDLASEVRAFLRTGQPGRLPAAAPRDPLPGAVLPPGSRQPPATTVIRTAGRASPASQAPPGRSAGPYPVTTRRRDRTGDPRSMPGRNYVVTAVATPWEPGAIRIIHVTGRDPAWQAGQHVDLVNQVTGQKLGRYEVTAAHHGTASIWDLR